MRRIVERDHRRNYGSLDCPPIPRELWPPFLFHGSSASIESLICPRTPGCLTCLSETKEETVQYDYTAIYVTTNLNWALMYADVSLAVIAADDLPSAQIREGTEGELVLATCNGECVAPRYMAPVDEVDGLFSRRYGILLPMDMAVGPNMTRSERKTLLSIGQGEMPTVETYHRWARRTINNYLCRDGARTRFGRLRAHEYPANALVEMACAPARSNTTAGARRNGANKIDEALAFVLRRAEATGYSFDDVVWSYCGQADEENHASLRQVAHSLHHDGVICFARVASQLSLQSLKALVAHELAHMILSHRPGHSESTADRLAERLVGERVSYSAKAIQTLGSGVSRGEALRRYRKQQRKR